MWILLAALVVSSGGGLARAVAVTSAGVASSTGASATPASPRGEWTFSYSEMQGFGSGYDGDFGTGPDFRIALDLRPVRTFRDVAVEVSAARGVMQVRGTEASAVVSELTIGVRGYRPLARGWIASAALAWAPWVATEVRRLSLSGTSTDVALGARHRIGRKWSLSFEARWEFIRYDRGAVSGGASGGLGRWRHGDIGEIGAGFVRRF